MRVWLAAAVAFYMCASAASADSGGEETSAALLIDRARSLNLAHSDMWLQLGRYERRTLGSGYMSSIVSESYFLADDGSTNPHAEIEATIAALVAPLTDESHALCRFPARARWLGEQLDHSFGDSLAACQKLSDWMHDGQLDGASLVLVAGYMSNPGSVYGHLLLKFHSGDERSTALLETSINYGAAASEQDSLLPYIAKGLFGGYRSTFTDLEFFYHNDRYRDDQLRDMWEYELALPQESVEFLAAHTWELIGQENTYYFLRQNCAFRIGELLETVIEADIVPRNKLWAAPLDIAQNLAAARTPHGPVVAEVRHLPSRQTRFREGFAGLPNDARDQVIRVVSDDEADLAQLAYAGDAIGAIDVLLDYYTFAEGEDFAPAGDVSRRKNELIVTRLSLDPSAPASVHERPAPHTGQRSSMVQLSLVSNEERGGGVEIHVRPVYYDLLSATVGAVPYSELAMADIRLIQFDDRLVVRQLDLLRVSALNISPTGAPGDGGPAWRVRAGLEDRDLECEGCLAGLVEGGVGKAMLLGGSQTALFGFVDGRLAGLDTVESNVQVGVSAGLLTGAEMWRLLVEAGSRQELDGEQETLPFFRAEGRFGSARQWDLRLGVEHREALEARAGVSIFW